MRITKLLIAAILLFVAAGPLAAQEPIKVFILAGQSNMEGKARVPLLDRQIHAPATAEMFAHLHEDGEYIERDDVWIDYLGRRGNLTVGFGSPNCIGMELEFGHVMGDYFEEPVLLIKTAWGGKSLARDFRPPSAGLPGVEILQRQLEQANAENREHDRDLIGMDAIEESYGHYYRAMIAEIEATLAELPERFPAYEGQGYELAGFVWFQGWNDQYNGYEEEYEANLAHLIRDVRSDLDAPELPVVIAVMGQNGSTPATNQMLAIQEAQLAVPKMPEFEGNVVAIRTDELVDKAAEELYPEWRERQEEWNQVGSDFGYHYMGSAVWFTRIGDACAEAMLGMMKTGKIEGGLELGGRLDNLAWH